MGIHDRPYARPSGRGGFGGGGFGGGGGGGGLSSMRVWSVNTWIIVICIAVFVIDGLLPLSPVVLGRHGTVESLEVLRQIDNPVYGDVPVGARKRPVFNPQTGDVLAEEDITWMHPIEKYMHFSTSRGIASLEFWRLIGFQFLHSHHGIFHLLFNMLGLYFFGGMVEQYLGSKRYLAFYLLCGAAGAMLYGLLNLPPWLFGINLPGLLVNNPATPLVGASAGVFGVIMAGAYLAPNARVLFMFFIPMTLKVLAYVLVGMAFFTVMTSGQNAGGEAGHLGGAIAGFILIRKPHLLHGFLDIVGRMDPTSHHYRHGGGQPARTRAVAKSKSSTPDQAEIDRILDKISANGLHSLTEKEKQALNRASKAG